MVVVVVVESKCLIPLHTHAHEHAHAHAHTHAQTHAHAQPQPHPQPHTQRRPLTTHQTLHPAPAPALPLATCTGGGSCFLPYKSAVHGGFPRRIGGGLFNFWTPNSSFRTRHPSKTDPKKGAPGGAQIAGRGSKRVKYTCFWPNGPHGGLG